jgi:hypothetical protein
MSDLSRVRDEDLALAATPSKSVESERAVLGSILRDPAVIAAVTAEVSAEDFYESRAVVVFAAMLAIHERGAPVDTVSLVTELRRRGTLETAGGPSEIATLESSVATSANAVYHAKTVADEAAIRRSFNACSMARRHLLESRDSPSERLEFVKNHIEEATTRRAGRGKREPVSIRADEVPNVPTDWLWRPYVERGELVGIVGDGGSGKTFFCVAVCAFLSRGWNFRVADGVDDARREPGTCLYFSNENKPVTLMRRLTVVGADLSRVVFPTGWKTGGAEGPVSLQDLELIEAFLVKHRPVLAVFDPFQSYIGADVDIFRQNETRPILDGLAKLARKHECSFVIVRHPVKGARSKSTEKGQGSNDIVAAFRSELFIGERKDGERIERAVCHHKANDVKKGPSLAFTIEGAMLEGEDVGRIRFDGVSSLTASDFDGQTETREEASKREEAKRWIKGQLEFGGRTKKDLEDAAKEEDLAWATVRRAATDLGVVKQPQKTVGGRRGAGSSLWLLPAQREQVVAAPSPDARIDLSTLNEVLEQPVVPSANLPAHLSSLNVLPAHLSQKIEQAQVYMHKEDSSTCSNTTSASPRAREKAGHVEDPDVEAPGW